MSYTYTQEIAAPESETTFVPSYARQSVRPKKIKTWMVLAPMAGIALIGGAAAMLMASPGEVQPLVEPAASPAAVSQPALLSSTPVQPSAAMTPAPAVSTPATPVARVEPAAPIARRAEPARRVEAAPFRRADPRPTVSAITATPAEVSGPRAYEAASAPSAPATPAPAEIVPAPVVVVTPLS